MDALRAIPEIVMALVLIYILGGGPVPAVIAIALHTGGALGKLFSEVAENADLKPVEGLASVGANWSQRMWLGVIPQVAPNWLSYALLRFEINVRASAILGFVGEGGIGHDLKLAMQWGQGRYDEVVAIFLLLFAAIVVIDRISDHYRNKLVKGVALMTDIRFLPFAGRYRYAKLRPQAPPCHRRSAGDPGLPRLRRHQL